MMYFDKETRLLVKGVGVSKREGIFSDYNTFDGIRIAQKEDDGYLMLKSSISGWWTASTPSCSNNREPASILRGVNIVFQ
ncbi:MAG: hypothetical protein U0793_24305 [Gemmataceae bacterium]